jgi:hypothetical protein
MYWIGCEKCIIVAGVVKIGAQDRAKASVVVYGRI